MHKKQNISPSNNRSFNLKRLLFLLVVSMICSSNVLFSQIINNEGAHISVYPNIFVVSKNAYNNAPGSVLNNGTINLTGNYTSTTTSGGNGNYTLRGNWDHTGTFNYDMSTVVFDGTLNQQINHPGINFYNFSINNTGLGVTILNNITVRQTLAMANGNINAGIFLFYLSNPAAAALNYASVSKSRIIGKFERGVNQAGDYLFPIGTAGYYNAAHLKTNSVPSAGTILSEFFTLPPANLGFPIADPPVEIGRAYNDGYWRLIAKGGFSISDFNINLAAEGFTDTIHDNTRLIKRLPGGDWEVEGTHQDADTINSVIYRNNLDGGISDVGTQFALGRARPLIIDHPNDTTVCEETLPYFKVVATGTPALRYTWYKVGVPSDFEILNSNPHFSGARTDSLTILGATLADAGFYYCIVRDRYGNQTRTDTAQLIVKKIPQIAITSEIDQNHECSNLNIDPLMFSLIYWDDVTTYSWVRNNPAGITAYTVPMSGTDQNITDVITGRFTNTSDEPVKIIFTIIPFGPDPTYCEGDAVIASVTVNPTPRVVPINRQPAICNDGTTEVELTTPTTMTKGGIVFDYTVILSSADLSGSTAPLTNLGPGYTITLPYHNAGDTLHSVFYTVTPRANDGTLGCVYDSIRVPEVKVHPEPLQDFFISTPFLCEGASDGALTALLSRGSKPDIISWDRPWTDDPLVETVTANERILPVQYVGKYKVTVTDELGCNTVSDIITITGATFNSYLYVNDKVNGYGTTCPESGDGELWLAELSGPGYTGVPPYVYDIVYNGQDTLIKSDTLYAQGTFNYYYGLPAGYYRLYLRDANGCINISYPGIEISAPPEIYVSFDPYVYPGSGFNISCLGYSNGSVKVDSISGGSGGYKFRWTTSDGLITGPDTLDYIDNLPAGRYYLTITDVMGCVKVDSITLTQPDGMVLSDAVLSSSRDGAYNISCNGGNDGSIDITIEGGSGDYLYSWSGTGTFTATTQDISGVRAGTYTCIVTDINGCDLIPIPVFTLNEPDPLVLTAVPSLSAEGSHNINCSGGSGSIDVTVTGGSVGNYRYIWSTTDGSGIVDGAADQNALTAGTYNLVVTDTNHCSVSTVIILTEPDPLTTDIVPTHITCETPGFSNGSAALTVAGGVTPYSFSWSNGAATEDISGLTEGTYIVTVTDMNGCTLSDTTQINLPPPVLYNTVISDYDGFNASCYGMADATININMISGVSPFVFSWQGPAGYTSTDQYITGLRAGDYTLLITDANYCTAGEVITVTEPGRLHMDVTLSSSMAGGYQVNCAGDTTGSIELVPVNNVGTIRYLWSDGVMTGNRYDLPAGDYSVIITDSNGCLADSSFTLTQPDPIVLTFETTRPWCPDTPDGEIRLTVTGGTGTDYTYRWSDNSTTSTISNISSGLYHVTVTDINMCSVTDSMNLEPVNEACLLIPNAISPNGDLINDEWKIGMIEIYPDAEVRVFNRWGVTVWRSEKGYPQPWDGRSNGRLLPVDSYHYIIDLNNGTKPIVGNITLVR